MSWYKEYRSQWKEIRELILKLAECENSASFFYWTFVKVFSKITLTV